MLAAEPSFEASSIFPAGCDAWDQCNCRSRSSVGSAAVDCQF